MTTLDSDTATALQTIAVELAFLSPQSVSSMGVVVSALEFLMRTPLLAERQDVQSLIRYEHQWACQVQSGTRPFLSSDHDRLQAAYLKIEESLAAPCATPIVPTVQLAAASTALKPEDEPVLFIRLTDDIELLNEFCSEGRELLEQIEQGVLVLEVQPHQKDMLNQVFRAFHTFKGGAGLLDLKPVKLLAHELESLLSAARNGNLEINRRVIDLILAGRDAMRSYVDLIGQRLAGVQPEQAVQIPINALMARARACLNGEAEPPTPSSLLQDKPNAQHVPDADAVDILSAHALEQPSVTAMSVAAVKKMPNRNDPKAGTAPPENLVNFVKIDTRKLDLLVDLVGELVIAQSLVVEDPSVKSLSSRALASQFRQLARITTDLQQSAMSLRMIPIRGTFQKMSRLVRDLSVSQNKQVQLQLKGEDTEIDRNMVEELSDPLMHMIRNAVDHGIEEPHWRVQNGKPSAGTILLQASHKDGGIVISISDDGKGMDLNQIRKKAIEKQLIADDDVLKASEILNLIFQPGFSMATTITDISGRGVGMDVVRGHIAQLRGRVEVKTSLGTGSEFKIRLPLTLAVIDGMLVRVGEERFILPILSIRESFKLQAGMISKVQGRGELVNIRGKLIPLVRLNEQLEIRSSMLDPTDGVVVVVESRSQWRGILVDSLIGKSELVIKPLGETFKNALGMTGCAILGDGHVALILDPDALGALNKTKSAATVQSSFALI